MKHEIEFARDIKPTLQISAVILGIFVVFKIPELADACVPKQAVFGTTGVLACGEFWLYRYQTLITGLLALAAAFVAYRAAHHQTVQMKKQTAIIARGPLADAVTELDREFEFLRNAQLVEARLSSLYNKARPLLGENFRLDEDEPLSNFSSASLELMQEAEAVERALEVRVHQHPGEGPLNEMRFEMLEVIRRLVPVLRQLHHAITMLVGPTHEGRDLQARFDAAMPLALEWGNVTSRAMVLWRATSNYEWRNIRALEKVAR